jgi:hypothetical protein
VDVDERPIIEQDAVRVRTKVPAVVPGWLCSPAREPDHPGRRRAVQEMVGSAHGRAQAVEALAQLAGREDEEYRRALNHLWSEAFEAGRLAALDELQDRFCVCMK